MGGQKKITPRHPTNPTHRRHPVELTVTLWRGMRVQVAPGWARNAPSACRLQDKMIPPHPAGGGERVGQFSFLVRCRVVASMRRVRRANWFGKI